jgi:hypothetical protein
VIARDRHSVNDSWSLPEDLDFGAIGVPTTEGHEVLSRPVVLDPVDSFLGGGQEAVKAEDVVGRGNTEAYVEAVWEWLVLFGGDEREKEPVVVSYEVATVGFESESEAKVGFVERAARRGVADSEVQVVEVHDPILPPGRHPPIDFTC